MAGPVRLRDQFAALERAMRDWELVDSDRFSFDDSDHFEEDSLCSWISEPESLCNNWRGWKKSNFTAPTASAGQSNAVATTSATAPNADSAGGSSSAVLSTKHGAAGYSKRGAESSSGPEPHQNYVNLVELSAKIVASHIPFEMVERFYPPVPEQLQLRIAFWSFPEHEEDIRLYSCLANGSAEEFQKGERLFRNESVSDILQIGFHLSATVKPNMREAHKVAVTFDRRRVTSCTCTCNASTNWCGHVVAVCLHRIFQSKDVMLRAPVSESLSRLHRDQLQKFAQYLISELPQQILPTAQRLLDELLSSQRSAINTLRGAPDPTAGASANEQTTWFLDERTLHGNIHKILIKFCVPAPIVFSDVNYLSSAAPPASAEWSSLLRPLRGREPEGMWNLLSIVREMFRREDRNAIPLLEVITEECLNCDQILVWWFNTKVALHNGNSGHGTKHHSVNSNAHACQHAGSSLCDEIVLLWRLAALNPGLSPEERCILHSQFKEWHTKIIEKVSKSRNASVGSKHANSFKNDVEVFPGFRPSIEACFLTWDDYAIPGVTYSDSNQVYQTPFMCFRHSDGHSRSGDTGMIHSSHAILNNPAGEHHLLHSSATISSVPIVNSNSKRPRSVDFNPDKNSSNGAGASTSGTGNTGDATAAASTDSSMLPSDTPSTSKFSSKATKHLKKHPREKDDSEIPSTSAGSSKSRAQKVAPEYSSGLPISASGLKLKASRCASLEQSSSFEEDNVASSSSAGANATGMLSTRDKDYRLAQGSLNRKVPSVKCPPDLLVLQQNAVLANARNVASDGNRSSVSSEGFCEHEGEPDVDTEIVVMNGSCGSMTAAKKVQISASGNQGAADEIDVELEVDLELDSDSSASARVGEVLVPVLTSKFDSSDSQQSGDEYQQLYYYDPKSAVHPAKRAEESSKDASGDDGKKDSVGQTVVSSIKRVEDPWEILFARAEGLHAHGHSKDACTLGVKLAGELLANPPDLTIENLPPLTIGKGKKRKINPASHQVSCLASATLAKCGFLCTVLAENSDCYYLAFQVGMFGLELSRPPASTKPLEVKLANQEAELAQLLKRICIGQKELDMIRAKATCLRDGKFKSRGDALLPLVLANFIFDALVMPSNREGRCALQQGVYHLTSDEPLGFEAAVAALGLKANVSEADHPLLCEGTRRQRGDLALAMLVHYKDDADKLAKVMDKLLDREIHQLYKAPLPSAYYSNNPPTTALLGATPCTSGKMEPSERDSAASESGRTDSVDKPHTSGLANQSQPAMSSGDLGATRGGLPSQKSTNGDKNVVPSYSASSTHLSQDTSSTAHQNSGNNSDVGLHANMTGMSATKEGNFCGGMSSSSKMMSSNNSFVAVGKATAHAVNSPNSCGSTGGDSSGRKGMEASNASSTGHSNVGSPESAVAAGETSSAVSGNGSSNPNNLITANISNGSVGGASGSTGKSGRESGRFKGKRNYPILPNQPSEAGAHFMFELAKIVLGKAGGSSNQSLFTQPSTGQNPRGPHRALHMCAFHMGLYALGLHNAVSPNWLSRTYSSHVSWITGQAMEIGAPAIAFLIDTWDSHLTPPEAVTIADRASRGDVNMVRAAAELALSCLPYAHALNPNEIHRAILQCKEQSDGMLEKACVTVETAAKGGGVYPEVLFDVARQWYSLYQKHLPLDVDLLNEDLNHHDSLLSGLESGMDPMNGHMSSQPGMQSLNQGNGPSVSAPCSTPTVSSSSSMIQSNVNHLEIMGMSPSGPPMAPHGQMYPLSSPQVPLASIPYGSNPYGQVPAYIPAYNPIPGNFMYGQAVIYQTGTGPNSSPSVVTTTSGYYNQQSQQNQPQNAYNNVPQLHQQPIHNLVSPGPALQYFPSVPISSSGPTPHMRPATQFYPVSHMTLHHGGHGGLQQPGNANNVAAAMVAAAAAAAGHVQHTSHPHPLSALANQGHIVAIPTSGPAVSCQQQQQIVMAAASNMGGHNSHAAAVAAHAHNMSMSNGIRAPISQSQINLVGPMHSHNGNGSFIQGNNGNPSQQGQNSMQNGMNNNMGLLNPEGPNNGVVCQMGRQGNFYQRGDMLACNNSAGNGVSSCTSSGQASAIKVKYLLSAYRVGMLAMETLARRVHDDRPAAKFARNPPYGEDVKWLLGISRKLGAQYLQQFCICAVSSIANPFVLHEIILDAALISSRNNLAWVYQNPRSPLAPLVQKCQQMYFQCLHQKLYHITLSDYEDFVNIVCTARQAFHLTPDGISQFKEWLQNLRRSKACKKDLWAQITSALQANPK